MMGCLRYLFILLWSILANAVMAPIQASSNQPPNTNSTTGVDKQSKPPNIVTNTSQLPDPKDKLDSKVINAFGVSDHDSLRLRLGDYVRLDITNLTEAMQQKGGLRPDQLRLYVNDIVLTNVPPYSADTANGIVIFPLTRNLATDPFWRIFYQFPVKFEHPGRLGIGSEISQIAKPYPAKGDIKVVLIRDKQLKIGLALVILLAFILFWLGRKYRLLKEDWSSQYKPEKNDVSTVPFSLAKVQLAFWTFLIIAGYFIIWLVTGELPAIPESLLALLGISLSEKFLGKGINFKQTQKGTFRGQDEPSAGFFWDILTDENGISLARLQFVLFNLIIGASFIRNVVKNWSLLDLDTSSLILLTISGAGYLIMKNTENSTPGDISKPVPAEVINAQSNVDSPGTTSTGRSGLSNN